MWGVNCPALDLRVEWTLFREAFKSEFCLTHSRTLFRFFFLLGKKRTENATNGEKNPWLDFCWLRFPDQFPTLWQRKSLFINAFHTINNLSTTSEWIFRQKSVQGLDFRSIHDLENASFSPFLLPQRLIPGNPRMSAKREKDGVSINHPEILFHPVIYRPNSFFPFP